MGVSRKSSEETLCPISCAFSASRIFGKREKLEKRKERENEKETNWRKRFKREKRRGE